MKKNNFKQLFCLFALFAILLSCSKDNEVVDGGKQGKLPQSFSGYVQKGPFVAGSKVEVYELDENLNQTGKTFSGETNREGYFEISASQALVSKYVKVIVDGYYFNEVTGENSQGKVNMQAITTLPEADAAQINVNVLTNMEAPRVLQLVKSGKKFAEAKTQAQKELLSAFLINDKTLVPEEANLIGGNDAAQILTAVSSILLSRRSESKFTALMSDIGNELKINGTVSPALKDSVARSSKGLDYITIKENIEKKYKDDFGKDITIGDFYNYIDGDGDGVLGGEYEIDEEYPTNELTPETIFGDETSIRDFLAGLSISIYQNLPIYYFADAAYGKQLLKQGNTYYEEDFNQFFDRSVKPTNNLVYTMWRNIYQNINRSNALIKGLERSPYQKEYVGYAFLFRALSYLQATEMWGDVPVILDSFTLEQDVTRARRNDVLSLIMSDLETAYESLPQKSERGLPNKYAAVALQARVSMILGNYTKAYTYATQIINSGQFTFGQDYSLVFNNVDNAEHIFAMKVENYLKPGDDAPGFHPTISLIFKGKVLPVVRYTETLLIAAECALELGQKSQAVKYYNIVSSKGMGIADEGYNKEKIHYLIDTAYSGALGYEGLRMTTSNRWGLTTFDSPTILPIPQQIIDTTPNISQNPGYK